MIGKVHSLVAAAATPLRYTAHDSTSILQNNGTLRYGHPGADILGSYFQVHLDGRASKVDGDRAAAADQSVQHALTPEASERHLQRCGEGLLADFVVHVFAKAGLKEGDLSDFSPYLTTRRYFSCGFALVERRL